MKCPRCEGDVFWAAIEAVAGGIKLYDRGEFATMVAVNADEIVRMSSGFVVTPHECTEKEKTYEERRDEWWNAASEAALKHACPQDKCGAAIGTRCKNLNRREYTLNNWPHSSRVLLAVSAEFAATGRKNKWFG